MSKASRTANKKTSEAAKTSLPPDFKICDPDYSLCPDCAKALRENTCPKMKELGKGKKK